ncbi:thioredoxin domain-containing protein [uncultured Psychroserpens sp.]|uniref:thioredoxin domain-containing protein n=1 Tax=uncultured Psychroserpens sp. TaxID=255436 RepID=UPI002605F33F|nr:thioredoxin domain-containing protein [uncultured Psychroserpens sp.]
MLKKISLLTLLLILVSNCNKDKATAKKQDHVNELINETSPYLLQHAYNPVDWKAWNSKSLKLAQDQNKLIVISVGYSACHWCHVMESESFESDSVAKLMNDNFISIKVDREERPDIDQIYMNAVQLMTGSGGWPLNCIALPDGRPVFGGTYFTKKQWIKILEDMSNLYKEDPEKVIAYAEKLTEGVKRSDLITVNNEEVQFDTENIRSIVEDLKSSLDFNLGGQKEAPKFPMPSNLNFLLRYSFQYDDKVLQDFVMLTLTKMANGGIHDQIGGGFSRYSIDDKWHVPHFEKMLYDNAQLVSLYTNAYKVSGNSYYKSVITQTLDFVDRELTHENGAFYSSIDADSKTQDGRLEEGIFYSWTEAELKKILKNDYNTFKIYYNINSIGKWENDQYILYKTNSNESLLDSLGLTKQELDVKVSEWKTILFNARSKRLRPRTDDKILTSWNALMLKSYLDAYRVIGNPSYLNKAIKNALFIEEYQMDDDGSLFHNHKDGKSTIEGFSEDYAHTISAFIELYQVTLDEHWLKTAKNLMDYSITHFLDTESNMFYFTPDTETNLIARKTEVIDNVIPSSNSVLAINLFKLSHYYFDKNYGNMAKQMLANIDSDIKQSPSGYTNWLTLYLNYCKPYYEVAISGTNAIEKLQQINRNYIPNVLLAGALEDSKIPIMANRFNENETYIYVCVDGTCKLPVTDIKKAITQLSK